MLGRLGARDEIERAVDPVELERGDARFLLTVDRWAPPVVALEPELVVTEAGQLELFAELPTEPAPRGYRLPELVPLPAPPLHRVRRLSYSALALFERCSYRYYAERVAGLREERGTVPGAHGLKATEIGDAVHRLLELVDLAAPTPPDVELVRSWYPAVTDEEVERISAFVVVVLRVGARGADRDARRARSPSGRSRSSTTACCCTAGSTCSGARAAARSCSTTRRTRSAEGRRRRSSRPTTGCSGSSTRSRASAPAPTRSRSSTTSSSGPTRSSRRRSSASSCPLLESELSAAIAQINAGEFVPTPERVQLLGLPGARPRLRGAAARRRRLAAAEHPVAVA